MFLSMICHCSLAWLGEQGVCKKWVSYSCADIVSFANTINVYDIMVPGCIIVGLTPTNLNLAPTLLGTISLTLMLKCGCSTLLSDSTRIEGRPDRRLKPWVQEGAVVWTPIRTLIRASTHVALAVIAVRRWRMLLLTEIFAKSKRPTSGGRVGMLRIRRGAWGLWTIRVEAIERAHASQTTLQARLLSHNKRTRRLWQAFCWPFQVGLVGSYAQGTHLCESAICKYPVLGEKLTAIIEPFRCDKVLSMSLTLEYSAR